MKKEKHIGIKIEKRLNKKFNYVCSYYGETAGSTLKALIDGFVAEKDCSEREEEEIMNLSINLDIETNRQFRAATKNEGKTITGATRELMKKYIEAFEREHGEISDEDMDQLK